MDITVPDAIKRLLRIVDQLHTAHPKKKFTLDGRLIGDLGETIVEGAYEVELFTAIEKHHDGKTSDGRLVQIKATMQSALTFPADHVPNYFIGIQIHRNGTFTEVFNGPGEIAAKAVEKRKPPKTNLHTVAISAFKPLNEEVLKEDRIPRRSHD